MSETRRSTEAARTAPGVDAARRACRRMLPDTYRCACGRVRDRCVRASVRALWSTGALRPARSARP
ncbi:hypothetical protein GCM10023176_45880 [Micromonospora coerulea]|uniref:Uncharacterized protein n=1 Tax=Micromonospora coerulea TaxID=47856 RepID=A0ABP8SXC6_9ACTN